MDLETEPPMTSSLLIEEPKKQDADDWFEAALLAQSPIVKPPRNSWGEDEEEVEDEPADEEEDGEEEDPDPFEDFDEDDFDDEFDDDFEEELEDEYEIEPADDGMVENLPGVTTDDDADDEEVPGISEEE